MYVTRATPERSISFIRSVEVHHRPFPRRPSCGPGHETLPLTPTLIVSVPCCNPPVIRGFPLGDRASHRRRHSPASPDPPGEKLPPPIPSPHAFHLSQSHNLP